MYNRLIYVILVVVIYIYLIYGELVVTKVTVRVPKENDIGLIFDLTVANSAEKTKEMLEFYVRSDGTCTLNVSSTTLATMGCVSRMFGGEFGVIEPSKSETVSLIWPTVSLYNRVGYCPIVITSSNTRNEEIHLKHLLYFDTRFEILDPESRSLRKHKDFRDCGNWDKEYLKNCEPVDCEERYFGKRSFYNYKTEKCELVPHCSNENIHYDHFANECVDVNNFVTREEIEQIRQGKFDNNFLELRSTNPTFSSKSLPPTNDQQQPQPAFCAAAPPPLPISPPAKTNGTTKTKNQCPPFIRSLWDFNTCFQVNDGDAVDAVALKRAQRYALQNFYSDWLWPFNNVRNYFAYKPIVGNIDADNNNNNKNNPNIENKQNKRNTEQNSTSSPRYVLSVWFTELFNGLLLVFATIALYMIICFVIFLIVTWITRGQRNCSSASKQSLSTPNVYDGASMGTTSSLLSRR